MGNKVIDQAVRDQLLSVEHSFIVQAPAGSGKTELLTQRILALLSVVEKPENILAITFTRKAAAEMLARVTSALNLGLQPKPTEPHAQQRWNLAGKVLQRDRQKCWRLIENPSRLNITTIDSLSASLSAALPLLSQTGALPKIADNATPYYQEAADNLLASIADGDETAEHIKQLLRHKDNNFAQVSELIAQMLSKRLQWLAQLRSHTREFDEFQLAHSLMVIITEKLQQAYAKIPQNIICELPQLLNQAASVIQASAKANKPYLAQLSQVEAIAKPEYEDLNLWKAIAELFLKAATKAEILSSFTVLNGFPSEKDAANDEQKQQYKNNKKLVTGIAKELKALENCTELFNQIRLLPEQVETSVSQQSLQSVVALMPIAVAHLKLVFSRYNIIDFPELSLASLEALGHPEMPSDLALAMDYRIEHILIDEFQDTSTPQIELIKLLTAGWQQDSARTLFLVGDPMQSIYRFRDANVSLFMQISQHGIAQLNPIYRQLQVNFRSSQTIVDWVNHQFVSIMPKEDDVTFSAVSYAKSKAFNESTPASQISCYLTVDADDHMAQAKQVIEIVENHLQTNQRLGQPKTLAILARSRSHFAEIIQLMNRHAIEFQALEIDKLSQKMVVKDLTSLAFALCDTYDELNWAACMRSPWFGLDLEDIRLVMQQTNRDLPLPARIKQAVSLMSTSSQLRCKKLLPILASTISHKGKKPFKKWLLGCFQAIAGFSQLELESDFDDFNVCLDKLDELSEGGELNDRRAVSLAIERLFGAPNPNADCQVQVMTIHKSKGLEFDSVILPRLDSGKRVGEQSLLKWTEVLDKHGNAHNLLAVSKETGKLNDSVYQYISYLDNEKSKYEDQRLLYVAVTRAKEKLYLLGNIKSDEKSEDGYKAPIASSFLSMLWAGVKQNFITISCAVSPSENSDAQAELYQTRYVKQVNLNRVAVAPAQPVNHLNELTKGQGTVDLLNSESNATEMMSIELNGVGSNEAEHFISPEYTSEMAAAIGSVLHRQLQWISENYQQSFQLPVNWTALCRSQLQQCYQFSSEKELETALSKVSKGVTNMLKDSFGKTILDAKVEASSELVLHKKLEQGSFLTRIVDRTFVYQNKRWVVDYKSSQPEPGETLSEFVEREKQVYFAQISDYFKLFIKLEKRPVIAGLYFPMLPHFEIVLESTG